MLLVILCTNKPAVMYRELPSGNLIGKRNVIIMALKTPVIKSRGRSEINSAAVEAAATAKRFTIQNLTGLVLSVQKDGERYSVEYQNSKGEKQVWGWSDTKNDLTVQQLDQHLETILMFLHCFRDAGGEILRVEDMVEAAPAVSVAS